MSSMCGEFTYELQQELPFLVVCHCVPCQKNSGANGSVNGMVEKDQVRRVFRKCHVGTDLRRYQFKQLSGELRTWKRMESDSGNPVQYSVCKTCNTIMRVDADAMPGHVIVKPGTLDPAQALSGKPVVQEIFTRNRPDCFAALKDAKQAEAAT